MYLTTQLTFTLQCLKSMTDSHNLSLEKHAKSVDLHLLLMYNWCFYRDCTWEARGLNCTDLLDNGVHFDKAGRSHRIELLSRYKRVITHTT